MPFDRVRRRHASGAALDPGFPALKAQVIARTGHHYYSDKDDLLFDRLVRRFRALDLRDATAYAAHLDGPRGAAEWSALEAEITIGETFFFRYAEQFAAIRDEILPALIEARRPERTLRIWSAGCATGAEPYSVSILLHDLLGASLAEWDVTILGTDISAPSLASARTAEYGRWALRTLTTEERLRWFQSVPAKPGATREGGYRLRSHYRAMVRFEHLNLMGLIDGTLPTGLSGFDLILCRNVLIYFSTEHVLGMMRGFADRLRPGGWLLIGHAEPNPAFDAWLTPVSLPGTAAYRRRDEPPSPPRRALPVRERGHGPAPERDAAAPLTLAVEEPGPVLPAATLSPAPPAVPELPSSEPAAFPAAPAGPDEVRARVRALADAGETGEAWRMLREALDAEPTHAALRYYEGLLALGLGREAEAERAFRGALFLERDFAMAHFQLGLLLSARGRRTAAARALDNALRLARARDARALLPEGDGLTAGEMVANARLAIGALAGAGR